MIYNFGSSDIIQTYKYLHTIPEPEFMEFKTSEYITEFLKKLNLNPVTCAKTGVYADIKGKSDNGLRLLIRADIDALPIEEESGVDFSSKNQGYMHACGHDMHTACLLYAAKALCENADNFSGTVRVLFQPAEEGAGGALPMINEGAAAGMTAAIAMHVEPLENTGILIYKNGSITASPDDYKIVIHGKGGHGAEPEKCINPLIIAAEIIRKYSTIKEDFFADSECVTTVCTCNGGTFNNIIPEFAEITGTARAFDTNTRYNLRDKLAETAKNICKKYGAEVDFTYNELYPPTINSEIINKVLLDAAAKTEGIKNIKELLHGSMTGDDFSYFSLKIPSSYFRLGVGGKGIKYPLHSPKFRIDEKSLIIGCKLLVNTALEYLKS